MDAICLAAQILTTAQVYRVFQFTSFFEKTKTQKYLKHHVLGGGGVRRLLLEVEESWVLLLLEHLLEFWLLE